MNRSADDILAHGGVTIFGVTMLGLYGVALFFDHFDDSLPVGPREVVFA